jgi:hypothetical protein
LKIIFIFSRRFEKHPESELGPVSFENRLYDDLNKQQKVQLPDNGNLIAKPSHYTTPVAATPTTLSEYASPMPPPNFSADYVDIAAAPEFKLPVHGAYGTELTDSTTTKKQPQNWVQFEEESTEKKAPISDFVSANEYADPYDLVNMDGPPMYTNVDPDRKQSVSLADSKNPLADEFLPDVVGDLEPTTPRLTFTNRGSDGLGVSKKISVTTSKNEPHTEC